MLEKKGRNKKVAKIITGRNVFVSANVSDFSKNLK